MRVRRVSALVVLALFLLTLLWIVTAFCVYQFGGPADGIANGLVSPEQAQRLIVNLASELSFLAILSCLFISIFGSLNLRSIAILVAATTFSLCSLFVVVTAFWADPLAVVVPIASSPTSHIFSEWNWLGFIFGVCSAVALATSATYAIFRFSLGRQQHSNAR
jgi:hypothetical protein